MAMSLVFREITDATYWDRCVQSAPWNSFPQSWAWGDFQYTQNHHVHRFAVEEEGRCLLVCQLIRYSRRLGFGYWVAIRGPVFLPEALPRAREIFQFFVKEVTGAGLPGRTLFYRFEPRLLAEEGKMVMAPRIVRTHERSPANTRILKLDPTEEALLAQMHHKTRYNIRLAEKHGVTIRVGDRPEDMDAFLRLMKETSERDRFTSHQGAYLRATHSTLAPRGMVRLRLAEREGIVLAANMEISYGDTATYLHGASSSQDRQLMAPYALQWEAIRAAKAEGHLLYDFWGCNPLLTSNYYYRPAWEGLSRFKQGWGAEHVSLIGTWDVPVNRLFYMGLYPKSVWR